MLRTLSRLQATCVLLALLALATIALTTRPAIADGTTKGTGTYSDVRLYHDIAEAVRGGEGYYAAATRLHRAHHFPTRPFVAVRLPTLAWIEAAVGWPAARVLLGALLALAATTWFRAVGALGGPRLAASLLLVVGGAMAARADLVVTHELWAGMLVALAIAFRAGGKVAAAVLATAAALAIRELALPFVVLALGWALIDRRWREAGAWTALLALFGCALLLHRAAVDPLSLPTDALSQGWGGLRGIGAPWRDFSDVTLLGLLPAPLSYLLALLGLVGFLGAPAPLARLALPWVTGVAVLLAVFARPVNFYWAILAVPTIMAGLAFLPRAAVDLAYALRRR